MVRVTVALGKRSIDMESLVIRSVVAAPGSENSGLLGTSKKVTH